MKRESQLKLSSLLAFICLVVLYIELSTKKEPVDQKNLTDLKKNPIIELKVQATDVKCLSGFCSQSFQYENEVIVLKNQSNFNKIFKGSYYYMYFIKDYRGGVHRYCILSINEEKRDVSIMITKFHKKSLFSVACLSEEKFFKMRG